MLAVIPLTFLFASVIEAAPIFSTPADSNTDTDTSLPTTTTTTQGAAPTPSTLSDYNGWTSAGCYVDAVDSRKLPVPMGTTGGPAAMTVELCLDACHSAGYASAGLEYSQECYCGTALPPTPATDGRCNMVCSGNPLEYCGGSDGLNVYQSTLSAPAVLQSYETWTYADCYVDNLDSRALPVPMAVTGGAAALTVELCLNACQSAGYSFAGVEWSQECYCGDALPTEVATDGRCSMVCNGNSLEFCGGSLGLNVYQNPSTTANPTTTTTTAATTGPTQSSGPSNLATYNTWTFSDCYVDSVANRVLPNQVGVTGTVTIESCLNACDAAGFDFAGIEYADECYCGKALPSTVATDGRCNMACAGDSSELCGGPDGISVYQSTSNVSPPTDLQSYNGWTPSGCFVDSVANRALPMQVANDQAAAMTIELCLDTCTGLGYTFAGLEYSEECYCGSSSPLTPATDGRCNMKCNGNHVELCGGPDGLSVYSLGNPTTSTTIPDASTSIVTTVTQTIGVPTTVTTDTTVFETFTGTTTYGAPLVLPTTFVTEDYITTTYLAPQIITTTIAVPFSATTTVAGEFTASTSIPVEITGETTIEGAYTYTTTIARPLVGSTTIPVPFTTVTTIADPVLGTTTIAVPLIKTTTVQGVATAITTYADRVTKTSSTGIVIATNTKSTGTVVFTSTINQFPFPAKVTTVTRGTTANIPYTTTSQSYKGYTTTSYDVEPVTIPTYTVKPYTTTSFNLQPFTSTSFDIEPVETTSFDIEAFTTTSFDLEPVTTETFDVEGFTSVSLDIEPVVMTTYDTELYPTISYDVEETTVPTLVSETVPLTTAIVTDFTTISEVDEAYTTTLADTETTTFTTTVASPITITTTIVTAVQSVSTV